MNDTHSKILSVQLIESLDSYHIIVTASAALSAQGALDKALLVAVIYSAGDSSFGSFILENREVGK